MLNELHVYHDRDARSAAMNMAIDESLLEAARVPSLRFYSWRTASLSFGYFGSFDSIAEHEPNREIVRRWTGGGIVFHGSDVTYSLILPARDAAASRAVYGAVHDAIRRALAGRINVSLADRAAPKISDACFANPVEADVMANGRKIAGAAQRRTRAGLLHQGSIQLETLPDGFNDAFAAELCGAFESCTLAPEVLDRADQLATERYASTAWLHRR
jgi:lipoate-protein ligase A